MSIMGWPWPTIWTGIAAVGTWAAVGVYYVTLRTLNRTLESNNQQTTTLIYAEILRYIGDDELRKARGATIFNPNYKLEDNHEDFIKVAIVYDRAALLASNNDVKARPLNFQAGGIYGVMKQHAASINRIRSGYPNPNVRRADFAKALEELWNWGVKNPNRKEDWNELWPTEIFKDDID